MSGAEIGLIGLGTMGAMLALNIAEKGHKIAVFNRTTARTQEFVSEAGDLASQITPTETLADLIGALAEPRAVILMVPAGAAVDEQIAALRPLMGPDDMIIDAGNANFRDTRTRAKAADAQGWPFLGIGVSGGAEGARHGPSIMGGGPKPVWDRVAGILTDISAKYQGAPCATWMGHGGAGHFVKTVHNGIEYADMQLIAETYGILRDGMGEPADGIADIFATWNDGPLKSYLIEISAKVAATRDAQTGGPLLNVILDRAGQKGTGRWTVIEAQQAGAPVPVIEAAVAARNMSAQLAARHAGESRFGAAPKRLSDGVLPVAKLESALIAGKILCYAQGFALLDDVGRAEGWDLPMADIARVWREGCIIRSEMLNDMAAAFEDDPRRNLMLAPFFADRLEHAVHDLRLVVARAIEHALPVPALAAALTYFDTMRTARSTANMIQGQRDFFGLHGFERLDTDGDGHHGPWAES